jgi:hypothetical protein
MASIRYLVCLLITFFVVDNKAYSQDSEVFEGMTWYLKKSAAIDSARSQGKQVFLVWGKTTCVYTRGVRQKMGLYPIKSLVNENYILWFSDVEIYSRFSPEVKDYLSDLPSSVTLPAICVFDMYDIKIGYGLQTGPRLLDELFEMLSGYVSNEDIAEEKNILGNVYVSGNKLIIKSASANETISVFLITGSLVDMFHKSEYEITRDLTVYPKGIFVVNGSSGWSQKFVVR